MLYRPLPTCTMVGDPGGISVLPRVEHARNSDRVFLLASPNGYQGLSNCPNQNTILLIAVPRGFLWCSKDTTETTLRCSCCYSYSC